MRLSNRRTRHKNKPRHSKTAWFSIGLFALLIAMAFYSWDFQRDWKRRLDTTKYYKDTATSSYNTNNNAETSPEASKSDDVSKTTYAPRIRPTNVEVDTEAARSSVSEGQQQNTPLLPLNLIPFDQLREHDYFSDSWIITRDKFLNLPRRRLGIVEDACFVAIGSGGVAYQTSKMFVDWTDFMVEHMSKWWNELRILQDADSHMFKLTLQYFDKYIHHVLEKNPKQPSTFHETIAVVAFAPYNSARASRGHLLTLHSLAATLASLYQVGYGRVVIAGYGEEDQRHVEAALDFLLKAATLSGVSTDGTNSVTQIQIGNTEFGFAKVTEEDWISTQWVKFNMPRGAVIGLQEALLGNITDVGKSSTDTVTTSTAWLGTTHDRTYWKYVYLTEPDTILHTKLELLPSIKKGLDDGLSFFPHRLQPIPHRSDLPQGKTQAVSSAHAGRFVPDHVLPFSNVTILDPAAATHKLDMDPEGSVGVTAYHCCDAGPSLEHENCGTWWWTCGFHDGFVQEKLSQEDALDKHKRLASYPLMRLKEGTGVVFGPTEHARKCIPSKTPCPMSISEGK